MIEFAIGTTQAGMVTLKSLGIPDPLPGYEPYSQDFDQADALVSGHGWALDVWRWGFLSLVQLASLRAYCPGRSAQVYIRTVKDGKVAAEFRAVLIWQKKENRVSGKVLDVVLQFRLLEELEPLP